MIKFTLPDFYYFHTVNDKFINLSRSHTNWLLDKNIVFSYIRGTFPYNIWNGGLNNMVGDTLLYPNIELISMSHRSISSIKITKLSIL